MVKEDNKHFQGSQHDHHSFGIHAKSHLVSQCELLYCSTCHRSLHNPSAHFAALPALAWASTAVWSNSARGSSPLLEYLSRAPRLTPSDPSLHLSAPGKFWNNLLLPDVAQGRCLSFVLCSAETRSEFATSVHPNHLLKESFIHKPQV